MPNWEEIQREWETSKITLAKLAEKHDVKLGTLKSRKSRDGWSRDAVEKDATKTRKVATPAKRMQPKIDLKEPIALSDKLTDKQRDFCVYYIKYFNATKAYQKAYECAYTTARVEGHRHLANPNISAEIDRMRNERLSKKKLSVDDILQKYIDIAFADITDFMIFGSEEVVAMNEYGEAIKDDEGENVTYLRNFVNFKNADEVDGTLISEVKQGKDGVSVKLSDKMKALDVLAKYTDLLSNHDKKRLQEEKFKADIEKTKAEITHIKGDEGEYEDDGFLDAINSKTSNVWGEANE
ncbi:terminase small subunit [Sporosarcina sp. A2]|uniref:terminase small subunit n=1 Tax=Sporosarcina sp. A2 TaxID=3393449 RepID=UPI003D79DBCA